MANELIKSSTVVSFNDYLNFKPFDCRSVDELLDCFNAMLLNINRSSLYFAFNVGKLCDKARLKDRFGIESMTELADLLHCTPTTLGRYKKIFNTLTPRDVEQLANRGVSVNAVLSVADIADKDQEMRKLLLEGLITGDLTTCKEVDARKTALLEQRLRASERYLENAAGTYVEDESIPEDLNVQPTSEESTDEGATLADNIVRDAQDSVEAEYVDTRVEEASQNMRDMQNVMKLVRASTASVRRNLRDIADNYQEQLAVVFDKADVLCGNDQMYDAYNELIEELVADTMDAANRLVVIMSEFQKQGRMQNGIPVPEGVDINSIFRS